MKYAQISEAIDVIRKENVHKLKQSGEQKKGNIKRDEKIN